MSNASENPSSASSSSLLKSPLRSSLKHPPHEADAAPLPPTAHAVPATGGETNVSVVIRLRPLLPFETSRGDSIAFTCSADGQSLASSSGKKFAFEHVFGPSVGQQEFFKDSGLVWHVVALVSRGVL